jgi:hypothetical protein
MAKAGMMGVFSSIILFLVASRNDPPAAEDRSVFVNKSRPAGSFGHDPTAQIWQRSVSEPARGFKVVNRLFGFYWHHGSTCIPTKRIVTRDAANKKADMMVMVGIFSL